MVFGGMCTASYAHGSTGSSHGGLADCLHVLRLSPALLELPSGAPLPGPAIIEPVVWAEQALQEDMEDGDWPTPRCGHSLTAMPALPRWVAMIPAGVLCYAVLRMRYAMLCYAICYDMLWDMLC